MCCTLNRDFPTWSNTERPSSYFLETLKGKRWSHSATRNELYRRCVAVLIATMVLLGRNCRGKLDIASSRHDGIFFFSLPAVARLTSEYSHERRHYCCCQCQPLTSAHAHGPGARHIHHAVSHLSRCDLPDERSGNRSRDLPVRDAILQIVRARYLRDRL